MRNFCTNLIVWTISQCKFVAYGLIGHIKHFAGFHLELNPSSKEEEEAGSDATGTEIKESRRRDWDVAIGI
jgi:hypothetical protein